jgi:histidinol phosphatase-like PHP family hydrolase
LPDQKIVVGKRFGCKYLVSSDSHGKQLAALDSATMIARRALLTRNDIVNSSIANVKSWLKGSY